MDICETCDYANRPPYKSPCSECDKTMGSPFCCYEHEEKPTNADRIRAMTDEDLKEFLCSITKCEVCQFEAWGGCELLEWLKQPAKGDA